MMNRRRFISIASAAALAPLAGRASTNVTEWRGIALGAEARLIFDHPESDRLIAASLEEIARLEAIFSLYRRDSQLARLNATGTLDGPASELVEVLGLAGLVHEATEGAFDPTIQPLWSAYANAAAEGREITEAERRATLSRAGWDGVDASPSRITLRPGMALTLNGIAQGYITDRVAARLARMGLRDVLCEMGEIAAQGRAPNGAAWPVKLTNGQAVPLLGRALASSAPQGTMLDAQRRVGHIFDPKSGLPSQRRVSLVSVSAPSAAVADALSTAGCLMPRDGLERAALAFPQTRIEAYDEEASAET